MAGRHGHKSTVAVQDPPTGPRHRSPDGSATTVTVADLVPEPRPTKAPTSPPPEPQRSRRWPWLVLLAVVLVAIGVARFSGDPDPGPPGVPAPVAAPTPGLATSAAAPTAPPAGTVVLPRIGGRNAEVVVVALKRMGLTDVRMVTDDDRTVDDPGKWTAIGLQPKPGTAVPVDRSVVVTVSQKD